MAGGGGAATAVGGAAPAPHAQTAAAAALPFNKMFVMVPVMLAARKLDGEDPHIVQLLRIAYGVMQLICTVIVVYTYLTARTVATASTHRDRIVYVPAAPQVSEGKRKSKE